MTYDRNAMCAELEIDEGFKLKAYHDTVGKLTIGVGRNLNDVGIRPEETKKLGITKASVIANGITKEQGIGLLNSDLDHTDASLDAHMPWWRQVDPVRQRVICNMAFNMGVGKLLTFNTLLSLIKAGKYQAAADDMAGTAWAHQVHDRATRLEKLMRGA